MKTLQFTLILPFFLAIQPLFAQDSSTYQLRLKLPFTDFPQNIDLPYSVPSMQQSMELSNNIYELGFWGIDALGDKIFIRKQKENSRSRKFGNTLFKFVLGLGFSKYGSELPIPLGVWGHEEFHRAVLGVNKINSKNGNWILNRWDGTVYGVSDSALSTLKRQNVNELLYSYVAGVQYEISLNQKTTLSDFYKKRTLNKNSLLLYNAWYVYDYFKFSTSPLSDSVKIIAARHESKNPTERDFAGADLTAWAYDMHHPTKPYNVRDSFPNGEGLNRRIGFSELSDEAKSFLLKQKRLSLLNFINPSIFFINGIKLNGQLSLSAFAQYVPTHFGNDIAVFLPIKYKQFDLLLDVHRYSGQTSQGVGLGLGLFNYNISERIGSDLKINVWSQPKSFSDKNFIPGGQIELATRYRLSKNFSGFIHITAKTEGEAMNNPYLDENLSVNIGLSYSLTKEK